MLDSRSRPSTINSTINPITKYARMNSARPTKAGTDFDVIAISKLSGIPIKNKNISKPTAVNSLPNNFSNIRSATNPVKRSMSRAPLTTPITKTIQPLRSNTRSVSSIRPQTRSIISPSLQSKLQRIEKFENSTLKPCTGGVYMRMVPYAAKTEYREKLRQFRAAILGHTAAEYIFYPCVHVGLNPTIREYAALLELYENNQNYILQELGKCEDDKEYENQLIICLNKLEAWFICIREPRPIIKYEDDEQEWLEREQERKHSPCSPYCDLECKKLITKFDPQTEKMRKC